MREHVWPAVVLISIWTAGRWYYLIMKEESVQGKAIEVLLIMWGLFSLHGILQ